MAGLRKFKKKPTIIEAIQVTTETFTGPHPNPEHLVGPTYDPDRRIVHITTHEGIVVAKIGDWIIKGVEGEIYPCKDSIFKNTYDEVKDGLK